MDTAALRRFRTARRNTLRSRLRVASGDGERWLDDRVRASLREDGYDNNYDIKYWDRLRAEMTWHYVARVFF
eukprot:4916757-Pyramimonas_sp.AAC.1